MIKQIYRLLKGQYCQGTYWNSYYLVWFKGDKYKISRKVTLKDSPNPRRDFTAQLKVKTYSITLNKQNASKELIRLLYKHLLKEEKERKRIQDDLINKAINSIYKIEENRRLFEQMVKDNDEYNAGML